MPVASTSDPQSKTASELTATAQALKVVADEKRQPHYLEIVVDEYGIEAG